MKNRRLFVLTAILMFVLGASDALRGIFSSLFVSGFGLSATQLGLIISSSYLGNLTFLLVGGVVLDKLDVRKSLVAFILLFVLSDLILLFGVGFLPLGVGFFLTLGLSTLLNTTVNLYSDKFSDTHSLMYVNILFFIQGVGMVLAQFFLSRYADERNAWMATHLCFVLVLVPLCVFFSRNRNLGTVPENRDEGPSREGGVRIDLPPLVLMTLSLGFYMICEHGVMNYLILYGEHVFGMQADLMGHFLALFSFGIILGRVAFSPLIDRVGDCLMMFLSLLAGTFFAFLLFRFGMMGATFLLGLASSTVYPTMVSMVKKHVSDDCKSRATTIVISIASTLDILFNMAFGTLSGSLGYGRTMLLLAFADLLAVLLVAPLFLFEKRRG